MSRARRPPFSLRYGAALAVTIAALLLKLLLVPLVTRDEPVLLFFAAVMVSAAFGGLGAGLFATVLGAIFDAYFFMQPFSRFELNSTDQVLRLAIFIVEGVFVSIICARMKSARLQAEENAAETLELEGQVLQISEAEQRRIGHDLHDGLSQHLMGIGLLARRLEETLSEIAPPAAQDASRLCGLAKTAVEWTRDLSRSLSPATLETTGLAEALAELASHAENIFHIECSFDQTGQPTESLDLPSRVHLYRIAQEAISNAVRHGRARHLSLRLDRSDASVKLEVIDDGVGIDSAAEPSDGLGLRIMRYRARMIGASIAVNARDGGGTIVTCRYDPSDYRSTNGKTWTPLEQAPHRKNHESLSSKITQSSAKD